MTIISGQKFKFTDINNHTLFTFLEVVMNGLHEQRDKASKILATYEDENEFHFHEVDRYWIINSMLDYKYSTINKNHKHD